MPLIRIMVCFFLLSQVFQTAWAGVADTNVKQLGQELQQIHKLESAGNTAAAIKRYESLIELHPGEPVLFNNLAVLMAKEGKLNMALKRLKQAMNVNQLYATVYGNISAVYVEIARGSYAKALQMGIVPQQLNLKAVKLDRIQVQKAAKKQNTQKVAVKASEPVEKLPVVSKQTGKEDKNILLTLTNWASAWSAQKADRYLSFYDSKFLPAKGMSRSRWAQQRRLRLQHPAWLKVTLDDFKIQPAGEGRVRVQFLQYYQSDTYQDRTRKEIVLQSSPKGWHILSEHSL